MRMQKLGFGCILIEKSAFPTDGSAFDDVDLKLVMRDGSFQLQNTSNSLYALAENVKLFPHSYTTNLTFNALYNISIQQNFLVEYQYYLCGEVILLQVTVSCRPSVLSMKNRKHLSVLCSWLSDDWFLYQQPDKLLAAAYAVPSQDPLTQLYHTLPRPCYHIFSSANYSGLQISSVHISTDVLHLICQYLDAAALFGISCTNRMMRDVASAVIPGLALTLYPHQYTSVWWMLSQEGSSCYFSSQQSMSSPLQRTFRHISGRDGLCFDFEHLQFTTKNSSSADDATSCSSEPPLSSTYSVRGGMLCDEPGLGKTVTMLAVIMRTLGIASQPPTSAATAQRSGMVLRSPEMRQRTVQCSSLLSSTATLIIVPDVLIDHWKTQINLHTNLRLLGDIFIDTSTSLPLPDASWLAKCSIVITSFSRLSQEWRRGKPMCASDINRPNYFMHEFAYGEQHRQTMIDAMQQAQQRETSTLLKIYWLRVVVDEGHSMGKSSTTNTIAMASTLQAERRWVLTGTPSRAVQKLEEKSYHSEIAHIHNLLRFLKHDPFSSSSDLWRRCVADPIARKLDWGWQCLSRVLCKVMIRHSKEDIPEIPKPRYSVTLLNMNEDEKHSYNAVVSLAKANIVTTDLDYSLKNGAHPDSLLNGNNRQFLAETMTNIRIASCGGGYAKLALRDTERKIAITLGHLQAWNTPPEKVARVKGYIERTIEGLSTACELCSIELPLLVLQPGFEACEYVFSNIPRNLVLNQTAVQGNQQLMINIMSTNVMQSSKASHVVNKILALEEEYQAQLALSSRSIIPKIIVFSQFYEFLDRVAVDLTENGVKFSAFYGKTKSDALHKFRIIGNIRVLLLTRVGSHGLDLSFVTHIFLMDSILDASLKQQVVSRAYRMGSRQSVVVEEVLMQGTIEEIIHRGISNEDAHVVEDGSRKQNKKRRRSHHLSVAVTHTPQHTLNQLARHLSLARHTPRDAFVSTRQHPHGEWSDIS